MSARKFSLLPLVLTLWCTASDAWAQSADWMVRKASGEVWVSGEGVQKVALSPAASLKPGDQLSTGKSGRVLLQRGVESILISPNSSVSLPAESESGSTTIVQQAGSILLEVEKRSENHFAVETPYLVAVVKGTQFRVTVEQGEGRVDVLSGQVEVADFKSGKYALVMPGQSAKVASTTAGLSVSGAGTLNEIKQGAPREPRAAPTDLPKNVLSPADQNAAQPIRIKNAIGDVKLDFQKVTKGIARAATDLRVTGRGNDRGPDSASTNSGSSNGNPGLGQGNGNASGGGQGNGNGLGNSSAGNGNGPGGGNGTGLGNGNGNGLGNGLGNALGNVQGAVNAGLGNVGAGLGNAFGKGACKGKGSSC